MDKAVNCTSSRHLQVLWELSDTTERFHFLFSFSCIGEGNGNPLQCSCLENPRDGGAWWAAVYGVAQSRTRLKRLSPISSSSIHNMPASLENSAMATGLEKVSFHSNTKEGNAKECPNYRTIAFISPSQASTFHEPRNSIFKLDLEKWQEPEIKLPTSVGPLKKQESSRKNVYFHFIDYTKAFDYVDQSQQTVGNS